MNKFTTSRGSTYPSSTQSANLPPPSLKHLEYAEPRAVYPLSGSRDRYHRIVTIEMFTYSVAHVRHALCTDLASLMQHVMCAVKNLLRHVESTAAPLPAAASCRTKLLALQTKLCESLQVKGAFPDSLTAQRLFAKACADTVHGKTVLLFHGKLRESDCFRTGESHSTSHVV